MLIMSPSGIETIIGSLPRQKTFIISSIFDSGLADFDSNIAFINLKTLENFFNLQVDDRNLEIYLKNPSNIEAIKMQIQKLFDNDQICSTVEHNKIKC